MANATKTRASRGASSAALIAADPDMPVVGALALITPESATEAQGRLIDEDLETRAFAHVFSELTLKATVRFALGALSDDIAKSHFLRVEIAARAIWDNDAAAIDAAKADNPGWTPVYLGQVLTNPPRIVGAALRTFGQTILSKGVRPWSEKEAENARAKDASAVQKAPDGKFVRTAQQHRWVDAASKNWKAVTKTDAEKDAARAARASKDAEKASNEAKLKDLVGAASMIGDDYVMPVHGDELFAHLLLIAQKARNRVNEAIAKKLDIDKETLSKWIALASYMDAKAPVYDDARNARLSETK